ncbi:MAG TPA: helix-turn-helix transcriptional regulator [Thermoanaerobaculia bacterium]
MRESNEKTLRQVLREAVAASGWTKRALERRLVLGSGNLDKLLEGKLEIKVRHLRAFAALLDVPVADFVTLGYPNQAAAAKHRLTDWIAPSHRSPEGRVAALAGAAPSRDELAAVVRAAVEEELARRERAAAGEKAAGDAEAKPAVP